MQSNQESNSVVKVENKLPPPIPSEVAAIALPEAVASTSTWVPKDSQDKPSDLYIHKCITCHGVRSVIQ